MIHTKTTKNPILCNIAQPNTVANTLNKWNQVTPENISQHPRMTQPLLTSDPLLPKKIHPAPGNQWCILSNMDRTHIKTHLKASPRVRNHDQRAPRPTQATDRSRNCYKCNTYNNQDRREHKWNNPPSIWPNRKNILTLLDNDQWNSTYVIIIFG